MRIRVTGNAGPLGLALVAALTSEHDVRWAPTSLPQAKPEGVTLLEGDLRDWRFAERLVEGCQALVHLAPLDPGPAEDAFGLQRLDRATRGTHTLLKEAAGAGTVRVVLGSSLDLFSRLPATWRVSESWRP